jgi:hypothetical protein
MLDRAGMNDLGVLAELGFEDGDADAAAEHAHQGADRGSLGQDVVRQTL